MQSNNVNQGAVALTIGSVPRRTVFEWRQFDWLFIFNNQWKLRHSGTILRGTNPTVSATAPRILATMQLGGPMALTLHLHDTQIIARQNRHFLRSHSAAAYECRQSDKRQVKRHLLVVLVAADDLGAGQPLASLPLRLAEVRRLVVAADGGRRRLRRRRQRHLVVVVVVGVRALRRRHRARVWAGEEDKTQGWERGPRGNDVGGTHNKTAFKRCCITLAVVGYIEFEEKTKLNNFHGH